MEAGCAIPPQKTHSILFEPRRLCYPWHPWYGLTILTRAARGVHADVTYLCKLPEAPLDAMLVEVPRWMFDAAQCAAMWLAELPHVECATLRALKSTIAELRAFVHTVKATVIQPIVSRQAGDGDTNGNDSKTASNDATQAVRRTPRRTAVARSGRARVRRGGETSRATAAQRSRGQSKVRLSRARRVQ